MGNTISGEKLFAAIALEILIGEAGEFHEGMQGSALEVAMTVDRDDKIRVTRALVEIMAAARSL